MASSPPRCTHFESATFTEPFNYASGGLYGRSPDGGAHAWENIAFGEPIVLSPGNVAFNNGAMLRALPPMQPGAFTFTMTMTPTADGSPTDVVGFLGTDLSIGIRLTWGDGTHPGQIRFEYTVPGDTSAGWQAVTFASVLTVAIAYDGSGNWTYLINGAPFGAISTAPWAGWTNPEGPALALEGGINLVTPVLHEFEVVYTP